MAAYRARAGSLPRAWAEMVQAGFLRGIPADPAGFALQLDPATGKITLDPKSTLNPLPTATARPR